MRLVTVDLGAVVKFSWTDLIKKISQISVYRLA